MRVLLEQRWQGFVDDAVSHGRYASADAVVEAGLRLLEQQEALQQQLRAKLKAALDRGGEVDDAELDHVLAVKAAELRQRGFAD